MLHMFLSCCASVECGLSTVSTVYSVAYCVQANTDPIFIDHHSLQASGGL